MSTGIDRLRQAGLKLTRQRVALARILFGSGDRHVTAEELHAEAVTAGVRVSLATVYNTLNQFTRAGLMREIAVASERAFFDTRTSNHCHYYLEDGRLLDIATEDLAVHGLPEAPTGTHIARIDVIVRLKPVTA